jgi:hypothetical protein
MRNHRWCATAKNQCHQPPEPISQHMNRHNPQHASNRTQHNARPARQAHIVLIRNVSTGTTLIRAFEKQALP